MAELADEPLKNMDSTGTKDKSDILRLILNQNNDKLSLVISEEKIHFLEWDNVKAGFVYNFYSYIEFKLIDEI